MKKETIYTVFLLFVLAGCGDTQTPTPEGIEPSSTIYTSNDDENDDDDDDDDYVSSTISSHNQGSSCLSCHSAPATQADGEDFLSGGTVYTALNATSSAQYANGYSIRLLLDTNLAIDFREGRGTGNSYSKNSALSSSYDFTAQVLNASNNVVNYSATNSHNTATHLNCNSCHSASGENSAPGRVVSFH